MNSFEYQLELAKLDEQIANAECKVVQAQVTVATIKHDKTRFIREYGEAVDKAKKEQAKLPNMVN